MIPLLLETHNFQSHGDCVLDFSKLDSVTLIIGEYEETKSRSNGAGKTSIFDAIDWVCFDQSRVSRSKKLTNDALVRSGQIEMWVRYAFIAHDGNTYRIKKAYKKKRYQTGVSIEFQILRESGEWRAVDDDGNKQTKKKIIQILGFDGDIWHSTALCKQHEVAGIAERDSEERLTLIKKLLKQDKWAKYAEAAKVKRDKIKEEVSEFLELEEKAKKAKKDIEEYNQTIKYINSKQEVHEKKIELQKEKIAKQRLQLDDINKIIGAIEQIQKNLSKNREAKERLVKENQTVKQKKEKAELKIEQIKKEFKEKTERQRVIDNIKPDKEKLVNAYRERSEKRDTAQKKEGTLAGTLESIIEQGKALRSELDSIKELGIGQCPTCKNEITSDHFTKVNEEYEEKLKALRQRGKNTKKQLDITKNELKEIKEKLDEIYKAQNSYNELIAEKNQITERLKGLNELMAAHQSAITNSESQLTVNNKELEELHRENLSIEKQLETFGSEDSLTRHTSLVQELKKQNQELEVLQQEGSCLISDLNLVKSKSQEASQVIEKAKANSKQTEKLFNQIKTYDILIKDFQKTIPTMILENSASLIEAEVNNCLTTLSDDFIIRINTQHKNKTNDNVREVFDIQVLVGDEARPFELLSGGEKFRVAFAIRVALSILLTQETGIQIGAIFYDEPFNDLDDDGLEKIQQVFLYLSSIFKHQLAITHQNRLKEIFNDTLCIVKGKNGSYIAS